MKRVIATVIVAACTILVMSTCNLITPSDEEGEIRFDLGLLQPLQLGYEVTHARCTLQHQVSGTVVERDLDIEADTASALIRGLRIGWWDLSVELLEGDEVVGSAATEVEVRSGDTTRVVLQVELATGGLEIVVNWKNGIVILDFDLAELATAGYDIAEVDYVLTHNASGESVGGQIIPETEVAYVEVTELLVGTWNLEVAFWQPGGDNPLCTTQYDLDIGPGITEELHLDVVSLSPLEVIPIPYSEAEPYGWPDLKITSFTAPEGAAPGQAIWPLVSVEVMNDGIGVASANAEDGAFTVSFYLSEYSYHGPFSEHLASVDVATPIAAGETVLVSAPSALAIPGGTPEGNYYLLVVVDDNAEVAELYENNNGDSAAVEIEAIEILLEFQGDPETCFDGLAEDQCHWCVYEGEVDPFVADAIIEGLFTTTGGMYSRSISLGPGLYDVYVWFELDRAPDPSDGDISNYDSVELVDSDVVLDLWTEVICGTVTLPDTSGWMGLDVYVALLVWSEADQDFLDLHDAGLIIDDDDRGYTWRPGNPGEPEMPFVLDVTWLVYETGVSEYYLFAYAEWDLDGEFEPEDGEPYAFYGYPGEPYPPDPAGGMNVDLNAKLDAYVIDM